MTVAKATLSRRDGQHVITLRVEEPGTTTPKGRLYPSVCDFDLGQNEAEKLYYELHAIIETLRGIKKKRSWWRFW